MNLIKSFHNRLPGKLLAVSVAVSMVLSTFALSDAYGLKDDHSGDPDYAQIDVVKEWTGGNPGVDTATFNILFTDGSSQSVTINGSPDETRWTGKAYIPKSKIGLYKGVEEALPGWAVTSCSDKVEFTRHLEKASSIERDEEYLIAAQGLPIVLGNLQNSFLTDVKNLDSLTYEKAKSQGFLWVSDRYNHFYSPDGKYSLNLYMDSYSGDYYFKVLRNMSANCTFSLENGSHAVLAAHRGLPSAKLFSDLDQMKKGDKFIITVMDHNMAYEVDQIETVLPGNVEYLELVPGQDYVTLVTCTPYAVNTHRLLVRGHRVPYEDKKVAEDVKKVDKDFKKKVLLLGALIAFIIVSIIALNSRNSNKKKTKK